MQRYKSHELPIQGRPCTPLHSCLKKYVTFLGLIAREKRSVLTCLHSLKVKSKQSVGVFTQRSGELAVCEAANLAVLLCVQMTWISQVLLTGPYNLASGAGNILFGTRHVSGGCTSSNVFSKMPFPTTHTIQTACKWFGFSGKKCFSCLASRSRRSNFSLVGVWIMSYLGQIVLSSHPAPVTACELRWVK